MYRQGEGKWKPSLRWILIALNALIFTAGVVFAYAAARQARGLVGRNVMYVSPKTAGESKLFGADTLKQASETLGVAIAHETAGSGTFEANGIRVFSALTYTTADYLTMNNLRMADGAFLPRARRSERLVVLSKSLAWKLFGGKNISGRNVKIGGENYEVCGVVEQDSVSEGGYRAWLGVTPGETRPLIENLYISPGEYNRIASYKLAESVLEYAGKNPRDYLITDMNEYILSMRRRPVLLLSAVGAVIAAALVIKACKAARRAVSGRNVRAAAEALVCAVPAIGIITRLDFEIWIPRFEGGGLRQFFITLTNAGLLPPESYLSQNLLKLTEVNAGVNVALLLAAAAFMNVLLALLYIDPMVHYKNIK
ncbi:MAG: ABC transporter permease [Clostridiales bacterium]|jgi:hypothetical protein|nr:ABC transporter permease [Clostridiales bacterium]